MMTKEQKLAIAAAWLDGNSCEYFDESSKEWYPWNTFGELKCTTLRLRVKREPPQPCGFGWAKYQPWSLDEVPLLARVRPKGNSSQEYVLIEKAEENGQVWVQVGSSHSRTTAQLLESWEYNHNGAWLPCGK